jgi:VanZ family protein
MKNYQWIGLFGVVLACVFIFYISSLSFPPTIPKIHYTSIIYHFFIFFALGFFLFVFAEFKRKFFLPTLIMAMSYAGLDELHQYFVPGRCCDIWDFATDSAGILVGMIFAYYVHKYAKRYTCGCKFL